jgi:hypothetical protein
MDETMRQMERAAESGEPAAIARLMAARARLIVPTVIYCYAYGDGYTAKEWHDIPRDARGSARAIRIVDSVATVIGDRGQRAMGEMKYGHRWNEGR